MKYQCFHKKWPLLFLVCLAASLAAEERPAPSGPVADVEALLPSLAARRFGAADFAESRERWAKVHGYAEVDVRVRALKREGDWVRVDFDSAREGWSDGKVYPMAWNEPEEGPAPFALHQRLRIWVSRDGRVEGFRLGHSVRRWRHRADGTVELELLDRTTDGAVVAIRLVPDRYAGSGVGTAVYWRGEGVRVGAAGEVPRGLRWGPGEPGEEEEPEPDREGVKTVWVRPGKTPFEEEAQQVWDAVWGAGAQLSASAFGEGERPWKVRLRKEQESDGAPRRSALNGIRPGMGRGRAVRAEPVGSRSRNEDGERGGLFSGVFRKVGGREEADEGGERSSAARAASEPSRAAEGARPPAAGMGDEETGDEGSGRESGAETGESGEASGEEWRERTPPVSWWNEVKERALAHRREAQSELARSRPPGRAIQSGWVDVEYENEPGEPLRADPSTLPLVPDKQFIFETRLEP